MPDPQARFADAFRNHQAGEVTEAAQKYRLCLAMEPHHADARHLLGLIAHQAGRNDDAVTLIGSALRLQDRVAAYHANLGIALQALHRDTEAVAAYRAALSLQPDFTEALYNLGTAQQGVGRPDDAVRAFNTVLCLTPDHAEACFNLGRAFYALGSLDAALAAYHAARRLMPEEAETHAKLATALHGLGRLDAAIAAYRTALGLKPDHAEAHCNLGLALKDLGHIDGAIAAYGAALRLDPDHADARYNRAIALLLAGRWPDAWPDYEWRWRSASFPSPRRRLARPLWQGEPLDGKTILLHAEQGIGDAIQFCRYVPLVAQRGGRVILHIHRPLAKLFAALPGVAQLVPDGAPLPEFDLHCPLLSLPGRFGTTTAGIPPAIPFALDKSRRSLWRNRLTSGHRRIGLVWQGNPEHKRDRERSMPLALFAPLADVPGVELIALQKGYGAEQIESCGDSLRLTRLGPDYDDGDFKETAAVLAALELVMSVDSAVAHLAGSLGLPVWVALPFIPDWRWLMRRDDTPWYPSMRLFRQDRRGDWESVIERMALALRAHQTRP